MKIGIGADHRGYKLKNHLVDYLINKGIKAIDYGTNSEQSIDYPPIAFALASDVAKNRVKYGILICFSGQGMAISANKVAGIRAAVCTDAMTAELSRAHNDANVLVLPARLVNSMKSRSIVNRFLNTEFDGGRHKRRLNKITRYENTSRCK